MNLYVAEFLGTMFMIILGNGVVANVLLDKSKGQNSGWMVITTGWALAVFVGVVIAGPHSGAHLNPAVSLGLAIAGKFPWAQLPMYVAMQFGGAMTGSLIVWLFYKDHFKATENSSLKAACFFTSPAIPNKLRNLFCEFFGAFVLLFVIFHFTDAEIANPKTPMGLGSIGAIPVTFLVWAIGLSLGGTTGYAINPARDLGPRIIFSFIYGNKNSESEWSYAWVPIVGPLLGAIAATLLVLFLY
ncbi:MIP/aquaporin family protein [Pedobacter arcticus]|uniref:MIP/aquaporin family protein n=1 Tax=Pedobacter arcticus TaxID=752140 RepID=UPI000367F250|nr:MIP/aquaporin family protein [Pedobacter arcticus]